MKTIKTLALTLIAGVPLAIAPVMAADTDTMTGSSPTNSDSAYSRGSPAAPGAGSPMHTPNTPGGPVTRGNAAGGGEAGTTGGDTSGSAGGTSR